ncbi:MAG: GatB/YqeY domain-containing protein [Peptostreptococcaceae bacterium]|nr:GatB/YqeY domain-containing protein [Peptostreptococcaceae bacterium]
MTLKEQLMIDFKNAMKSHNVIEKNTVNLVRAAIKQVEVDTRTELEDQDILVIIAKQVKMRNDALPDFEKAGRTDLVDSYKAEIEVLNKYLPEQISEERLKEIVEETAKSLGINGGRENMGKLMGPVMVKIKGLADGNTVKKIVMEYLS